MNLNPKQLLKKPLHYDKLWFFYLNEFLGGLSGFIGPVLMVYFLLVGFDYLQNSILFATWTLSIFIFEIPTGAIADLYGRKLSVTLSFFLGGIFAILIGLSSSFYILLILVFLMGASSTLMSGAERAWLVDYVKQKKLNKDMQKVISNIYSYAALGSFIAFGFSTYLIYLNVRYVWYITGICYLLLSIFTLIYGPENFKRNKDITISNSFKKTYDISKEAIKYVKNHNILLWIFLGTFTGAINSGIGGFAVQPYLLYLGLQAHIFGPIMMFFALCAIFTPQLSGKYLKLLKTEKRVLISSLIIGIIFYLALISTTTLIPAVSFFLIFGMIGGIFSPTIITYVQKHTPSEIRATAGSVESMLNSLGWVIGLPLGGYILNTLGFKTAFIIGISLTLIEIYFYLKINNKKPNI